MKNIIIKLIGWMVEFLLIGWYNQVYVQAAMSSFVVFFAVYVALSYTIYYLNECERPAFMDVIGVLTLVCACVLQIFNWFGLVKFPIFHL